MSNKLFNRVLEDRNGHYCHAVETDSVYAFKGIIEAIVKIYRDAYKLEDYIDFFNTIALYYLPIDGEIEIPEDEQALYDLNISEVVTEIYEELF